MTDETTLVRARTLARALDSAVRIPGTQIRFGLDAVLGLIPGVGDVAGAAFSGYLIVLASKAGAPVSLIARMVGNVLLDTVVGFVPVLGDMFDVVWRSNKRNLALLERYQSAPVETKRSGRIIVFMAAVALLCVVLGGFTLFILLLRAIIGLFFP